MGNNKFWDRLNIFLKQVKSKISQQTFLPIPNIYLTKIICKINLSLTKARKSINKLSINITHHQSKENNYLRKDQ